MRGLSLIDRYIAKSVLVPLLGTLVLAAALLVLDKMLRLFDFVINSGGPVSVVWRMLANLLPEYFALGIPIGLLLGVLLAFRKLAVSSELDALRGVGAGFGRLLRVPYAFAVGLLLLNLFIVGWLQPWTHYGYERLRFDLRSGALGASLKVGEFNTLSKRFTLRIDRSERNGTQLHGIFVQADDNSGTSIVATAQHGRFLSTDDPDTILFRLDRGRLIQQSAKFQTPRTLSFQSYDLPINLPQVDRFRARGAAEDEVDERTLPELLSESYGGTAKNQEAELAARSNLHFRLVEVAMMLLIPLLAVALAVPPKRSASSLGIFVGIVLVVAYHKLNQWAEGAGTRGKILPEIALWVPFLLFAALIVWMYRTLATKPGGQPIGSLERAAGKVGKAIRGLLPQFGREAEAGA
ncbi:MAG: Lipopolysaccharide export system permease protein LptF [uncultured Sphingomonas sp.]|uniref:Lipopolysaccharide export system permease protein LptF n=1 Tax=uncultured Sphingomonas sp. TaxID=158754 RepID=A0A6J4SNV3_9SPHN|nr:LPS export ABC transporter permease LptF [uncultured Sphingomonas sp.]CAA9499708.1 MAG: Lipopolysaccharide export system permease protein LptF [uncultured Sphingomonas sp.]